MRRMLLLLTLVVILSSSISVIAQKVWDDDYRTGPCASCAYAYVEAWYVPGINWYFDFRHRGWGGAGIPCYVEIWVYPGDGGNSPSGGFTLTEVWAYSYPYDILLVAAYAQVGYV